MQAMIMRFPKIVNYYLVNIISLQLNANWQVEADQK